MGKFEDEFERRLENNERSRKLVSDIGGGLARQDGNEEAARQIEEIAGNRVFVATEAAEAIVDEICQSLGVGKEFSYLLSKAAGAWTDAKIGQSLNPKIGKDVGHAISMTRFVVDATEPELRQVGFFGENR